MAFIVIEGIDGCGKSTHAALLDDALRKDGNDVELTHSYGGTEAIGDSLAKLIKGDVGANCTQLARRLMVMADDAELINTVIERALSYEATVISDRYDMSGYVYYPGIARHDIYVLNSMVYVRPDVYVLLDLPATVAMKRAAGEDHFETASEETIEGRRRDYIEIANSQLCGAPAIIVDADRDTDIVAEEIYQRIQHYVV